MINKMTQEYLEELSEDLAKELKVELEEKNSLMNLIHFYEAFYNYLDLQVNFENMDRNLLINAHQYAENQTNIDMQSLYVVQSAVKYPEFLELSNFNKSLKH